MRVFGAVVNQQQDAGSADRIGEQVQERLRIVVDPMQIFEDDYQRLVETLAQQDAFDRFQRALLPDLPVHLRQRIGALYDTEQSEQVRQRILQTRIERERASSYFLAAPLR